VGDDLTLGLPVRWRQRQRLHGPGVLAPAGGEVATEAIRAVEVCSTSHTSGT